MLALEKYVHAGTLGEALISVVKLRASQINGCAFCLNMHSEEARKAGVDARNTGHETRVRFDFRERAP